MGRLVTEAALPMVIGTAFFLALPASAAQPMAGLERPSIPDSAPFILVDDDRGRGRGRGGDDDGRGRGRGRGGDDGRGNTGNDGRHGGDGDGSGVEDTRRDERGGRTDGMAGGSTSDRAGPADKATSDLHTADYPDRSNPSTAPGDGRKDTGRSSPVAADQGAAGLLDRGDPDDLARTAGSPALTIRPLREGSNDDEGTIPVGTSRILPWHVVARSLTSHQLDWTWLDAPIKGEPRSPGRMRELDPAQESAVLQRGWR